MKRFMISCIIASSSIAMVCAQSSLPQLKEGTNVSIPLNEKDTKGPVSYTHLTLPTKA